jgi:hypothetical protein
MEKNVQQALASADTTATVVDPSRANNAYERRELPTVGYYLAVRRRLSRDSSTLVGVARPEGMARTSALALEQKSFDEGVLAGAIARVQQVPITAYHRVGRDSYAQGYRKAYFARRMDEADSKATR